MRSDLTRKAVRRAVLQNIELRDIIALSDSSGMQVSIWYKGEMLLSVPISEEEIDYQKAIIKLVGEEALKLE